MASKYITHSVTDPYYSGVITLKHSKLKLERILSYTRTAFISGRVLVDTILHGDCIYGRFMEIQTDHKGRIIYSTARAAFPSERMEQHANYYLSQHPEDVRCSSIPSLQQRQILNTSRPD